MFKKIEKIGWGIGLVIVLFLAAYLYSVFFKPNYYGGGNTMGLLIIGLLLGAIITFLAYKLLTRGKYAGSISESSHTVVESMRKVFKIVCAEGHFNEIYNYEETKRIFNIIPNTKKALVIVQARVLVGYDFEKCKWETDEASRKLKIVSFPEPQILSIETDYKYYNMEENFFNMFSREDLQRIQQNGKKQVEIAALNSNLRKVAAEQMRTLLTEVIQTNKWSLEDSYKITSELPASTEIITKS